MSHHPGTLVQIDLGATTGREPSDYGSRYRVCVVVSRAYGSVQVVVPLTSVFRPYPSRVPLGNRTMASYAQCENARAVSTDRYLGDLGNITADELAAVRHAVTSVINA